MKKKRRDNSIENETINSINRTVLALRAMMVDPTIHEHVKTVIKGRIKELEEIVERYIQNLMEE